MAEGDRERWDERHLRALGHEVEECDPFVLRAHERLGAASERSALDLACGRGRHALELARRGWLSMAWDVSPVALEILRKRASTRRLLVATRLIDASGERPLAPPRKPFDLVVVVNYLERALFPRFCEFVAPNGHLLFATFTVDRTGDKPSLQHCLERGELARGLPGFATEWEEERGGRAGLLGRRAVSAGSTGT